MVREQLPETLSSSGSPQISLYLGIGMLALLQAVPPRVLPSSGGCSHSVAVARRLQGLLTVGTQTWRMSDPAPGCLMHFRGCCIQVVQWSRCIWTAGNADWVGVKTGKGGEAYSAINLKQNK